MRKTTYDQYYQELNYLGNPYPKLVKFFSEYEPKGKVLDLGCGQGRDSLCISRCGYDVIGIDISKVGIDQMNAIALEEDLSLKGIIADLYTYPISQEFDIVLLDSIVHFYKKDIEKETALMIRIAKELKIGGIICNFTIKGAKREKHLKSIFDQLDIKYEVLVDEYTPYPEYDALFHMYVIKKLK